MINRALQGTPDAATHWSTRTLGQAESLSKSTVQRWLALFGVQPHRAQTFKLSADPFFIEKVRDIVGLYLNPPDHAMVLCVDEKSQIQALNRTQPTLPMGLGYAEGYTHDLRPAWHDDAVCRPGHRHGAGVRAVPEAAPPQGVPVVPAPDRPGGAGGVGHPPGPRQLRDAQARHGQAVAGGAPTRFHLHFTPTSASWLNQVERWFGVLSQRAIKRGSFRSVADLVNKIRAFIDDYNTSATPFVWVATAQSIIDKVARIAMRISGTAH